MREWLVDRQGCQCKRNKKANKYSHKIPKQCQEIPVAFNRTVSSW